MYLQGKREDQDAIKVEYTTRKRSWCSSRIIAQTKRHNQILKMTKVGLKSCLPTPPFLMWTKIPRPTGTFGRAQELRGASNDSNINFVELPIVHTWLKGVIFSFLQRLYWLPLVKMKGR